VRSDCANQIEALQHKRAKIERLLRRFFILREIARGLFYFERNWDSGGMLGICLPAVSPSALVPLALAWAWFCVNLLPEVLQHHER